MSSKREQKLIEAYGGRLPTEEDFFYSTRINQAILSLLVAACGVIIWLCVALVHAENDRLTLERGQCADPVFKGSADMTCLRNTHSREHWWQHLWFALTHLSD